MAKRKDPMPLPRFEMYPSDYHTRSRRDWRWRFLGKNGEIIAISSEGYRRKIDCRHSIRLVADYTASFNNGEAVPIYEAED